MLECPDCGNPEVRVGARYCDACGNRLPPQVGYDPDATLPPGSIQALRDEIPKEVLESSPGLRRAMASEPPPTESDGGPRIIPAERSAAPAMRRKPTTPAQDPPPWARGSGWEAWSAAGPMPERIRVDGAEWVRVDEIDVRNRESEDKHGFRVQGTGRLFRERETFRYPGGNAVEGRGYRHQGGSTVFRIGNLVPDAQLVIIRQMLALGHEQGEVRVSGNSVGSFREGEVDSRAPWRNRAFVVPPSALQTDSGEVSVEVSDDGSERGLTWFHVWCYQPAEAADAYSAALDVAASRRAAGGVVSPGAETAAARMAGGAARFRSWSQVREAGKELPLRLSVDGAFYQLVDVFGFADPDSVEQHSFAVMDSQGSYAGYQINLGFPDGASIQDQGITYEHGESTWEVTGLTPGKEVAFIFRTDVQKGNFSFELSVDGYGAGKVRVDTRDPVNRGRHWECMVPGRMIKKSQVRFRAAVGEPGTGVPFFRLWFYQAA